MSRRIIQHSLTNLKSVKANDYFVNFLNALVDQIILFLIFFFIYLPTLRTHFPFSIYIFVAENEIDDYKERKKKS